MKTKYKKTFFLLLALCAFADISCKKFLDVPPEGRIIAANFWKNRSQALGAIGGLYSNLGCSRDNWTAGAVSPASATKLAPMEAYIYWGEIRGELLTTNVGVIRAEEVFKENVDSYLVSETDVTTSYTSFYRIINEANQAIKNIPGIPDKDPNFTVIEAQQFVAEAYFIRAFCYFWLTRTFKEVPLVLNPSERDDQTYNIAKSTQEQILTQIVSDLTIAKNTLPTIYANTSYQHVRATRGAAMTVLADVYLWMGATAKDSNLANGFYDKAIENCDAVISSGRYFLLPGPKYGDLFNVGETSESIFETFADGSLNGQSTSMYAWFFNNAKYWVVNTTVDNLFDPIGSPDYRSSIKPPGPIPATGGDFVSYDPTTRLVKKYFNANATWIFYRYADVLLMKAEALSHRYRDDRTQLDLAAGFVNQVRRRAFGVDDSQMATVSTTVEMDNAILDERAREFIAEGKRWFDLVRFGLRDNTAHPELLTERILASRSGSDQLLIGARINNPDSWYFPLNAADLAANPNLVQNSYYK
ncbi:RagB/SusD family nutrient uptake outer membrane protein [Pedobacter miscanthi]|uniref:RagB/SusD family nutrient uptake outer membrane protein n=1 Tax=Pedobacter miscanthi TaxID=2259170 RepID=A0A366L3J0_9SPHI|nr:RagB/SusD family nutrient uptake outer membrane protein [Pedobacter miscanthi]RBQ07874.1 hypothetical protein DRW42_09740 [Pedobacter miscanthi]